METMWMLHVENFGRIESADIEVSPLTLFVGDNNSGKSYLLALIYGLMRTHDVLSDLCENSLEYKACVEWVEKALEQATEIGDIETPFDDYVYTIFENLFNRILESNQAEILRSIFNKDISAGKIHLTFHCKNNETLRIFGTADLSMSPSFEPNVSYCIRWSRDARPDENRVTIWYVLSSMIMGGLVGIQRVLWHINPGNHDIFYFPTARTGFLLTYPALTKDAFSRAYNRAESQNPDLTLTRPCTDFLGNLTTVRKANAGSRYKSIVRFIENGILHGKIVVSNDLPLPVFSYRPETMKTEIPMFLTSDVIKEMTPLLLALQYQNAEALFIEEPEMNLHPQLQQTMARVLVKLVNAGMPVFAATHSDTILQHINNMVKLSVLPKKRQATLKKRFDFDKDDLIPADKISMYQFDVQDNGKTAVRKLSCGQYGFEIPTFYAPLEALLRQTQDTEPGAEEYED